MTDESPTLFAIPDNATTITRLRARLSASADHHATSAAQFTFYAQQHRAKSPPDVEKAETNEREADRCMEAAMRDRKALNDG